MTFRPCAIVEILGQGLLFVGPAAGVLRLDEADVLGRPAHGLQMIEDVLHQQLADVRADVEVQICSS